MKLIDFYKDVFSVTDIGLVRQANEDNCYAGETQNGFLFIVCDGMGGHAGGARASTVAVNSIVKFLSKEYYAVIHQALADALAFANRQILGVATVNPELKGMGTTACVLLLRDDKAWFAHIGDSRIYLYCNKQQQLHRLTKDHSVVQGLVDQSIISEAEAEHHPQKNQILKTLGVKNEIQPEVCSMPTLPAKGDVFLICSDGLSGMLNDDTLQNFLRQKISLQEKGENMLSSAIQAGGKDNITIQLIHVSNSPHQNTVFKSKNSVSSNRTSGNKTGITRNVLIIIAIVLFAVISTLTFLLLKPETGEKTKDSLPVTIGIPKEKAWEKRNQELGFNEMLEIKGNKVFVKKVVYGKEIDAVIVPNSDKDSYSEKKITLYNNSGVKTYIISN